MAALVLVCYGYFFQGGGANQNSRFDLARSIVERHSLSIDSYDDNTLDKAVFGGHVYSDKAPGQALAVVPFVALAENSARVAGLDPVSARVMMVLAYLATLWASALPTAVAGLSVGWTTLRLGASRGGATFAAIALLLGTPAWAYATVLWGNSLAMGCLSLGFAAAVALLPAGTRRRDWSLGVLVGGAAGWAVVTEYPAAPAAAAIAGLALVHASSNGTARVRRVGAGVLGGALVAALVLASYNLAAFGSPLYVSYAGVQGFPGMREGFMGVTRPSRAVLQEILVGRFRGLLLLAPVLTLAPVGLYLLLRRGAARPSAAVGALIAIYYLLFNASYFYWDGGHTYGPRHLGAALPFMSLGVAPLWSAWGRPGRVLLLLLTGLGAALALMAVSTMVAVPNSITSPIDEFLWPNFAAGALALNRQGFAGASQQDSLLGAWNLGQLGGLTGLASLIPLGVIVLGALAAWYWIATRAHSEPAGPAVQADGPPFRASSASAVVVLGGEPHPKRRA